jgi:Protein of unknown function (DUF3237)
MSGSSMRAANLYKALIISVMSTYYLCANAQQPPLGTTPSSEWLPKAEFVFEERVTLSPAVVLGETPLGHRQYIPITGGKIAGPKLNGEVIPGGWDFQLRYTSGCGTLSADYFLRADDGTVIHILNEGFNCGFGGAQTNESRAERMYMQPRFEAPKGKYDWLTKGTFVATIELDMPPSNAAKSDDNKASPPAQPKLDAIRIKFYQIK